MQTLSLNEILGDKADTGLKIRNRLDLVELGAKGLTKDQFLNLAKFLGLSVSQLAELVPVSERTIARHKPDETFGRNVSEHLLQIAEMIAWGMQVFESREKLLGWLNFPSQALAGKTPMSLLASRFGTEMVKEELCRIEHGVYA